MTTTDRARCQEGWATGRGFIQHTEREGGILKMDYYFFGLHLEMKLGPGIKRRRGCRTTEHLRRDACLRVTRAISETVGRYVFVIRGLNERMWLHSVEEWQTDIEIVIEVG